MHTVTRACTGLLAAAALMATAAKPSGATPAQPLAQTSAAVASILKFEVASIKLMTNDGTPSAVAIGGAAGAYFRHAGSIRVLINRAYQVPFVRQLGGPEWIREDNYSINAKIPDGVAQTPDNMNAMIRALLADRFNLAVREEEREVPVYALLHSRDDKKLGPKLQASTCPPPGSGQKPTFPTNQAGVKWESEQGPRCGQISGRPGMTMIGGFPLARFADFLQNGVGRPVIDRTGLTGDYVLEMTYAPQALAGAAGDDLGPSLFTAIRDQLGLKLESDRALMKVVVIDSIQRPTED